MKAKGFTLVEALVSLMISVTVLGAGIQSSRSGLRATQVASDQLLMSGLADEVVADLTVLRYSSTSSSSPGWKSFSDAASSSLGNGLAISENSSKRVKHCEPTCETPANGGPIVMKWAVQNPSRDYSHSFSGLSPVCTSWMPNNTPSCGPTSYESHTDEIAVINDTISPYSNTGITSLSTQLQDSVITDQILANQKKEFFDLDVNISNVPLIATGIYTVNVTLTNHADPTIIYSRTQLLADTP